MERKVSEFLERVHAIGWGFAAARVLTVANRVGLLRLLARGDASPDEAAAALGLDGFAVRKILGGLAAHGLVDARKGRFSVPASVRPLLAGGPSDGLGAALEHYHLLYEHWGEQIEGWVRTGSIPIRERSPEQIIAFVRAMKGMTAMQAQGLARALDVRRVRRFLDLGGALATYAIAFCRLNPDLAAVVCDQPVVCAAADEEIAHAGLSSRIRTLPGDYLEVALGDGFDLVLLSNVIHQESRERAAHLVRRAAGALAPGGRVAVVDVRIDPEKAKHPFGTLFAVNMRDFGDTYSEVEIAHFFAAAGLADAVRVDLDDRRWLITARKADPEAPRRTPRRSPGTRPGSGKPPARRGRRGRRSP